MKITTSKDLVKVNQILPIMQEHCGQNMNLARIKLMALLLLALCVVQTVSIHKLAGAIPTDVDREFIGKGRLSNMAWKRLQPYLYDRLIPQNSMFSNFCHILKFFLINFSIVN